ncbi:MAG: ACT domain-containing protein [Thermoproteota archaeon]
MRIVNLNLENTGFELAELYGRLAEEAASGLMVVVEPREETLKPLFEHPAPAVSEEDVVARIAGELNSLSKNLPEGLKRSVEAEIVNVLNKITEYVHAEKTAGEKTPRGMPLIMNLFGNTVAMIVSSQLRAHGIDSRWVTAGQLGFTLIEDYEPPWSHFVSLMKPGELRKAAGRVLVVSGRTCVDADGEEAVLRKSMSSAVSIMAARELGVREVYVPKSNGGIYTADPLIVENAQVIPSLSYAEALELSRLGEWVVSPQAVELSEELEVRIVVSSVSDPFKQRTLIGPEKAVERQIVKAVAWIPDMSILTVEGAAMAGTPGVASAVLGEVAKRGVSVSMISQDASEIGITMIVKDKDLERALKGLREGFSSERIVKRIHTQRGVAVISAVGEGMRGTRGVAARIFSAVADAGVNVLVIAQGSSETSISFAVQMEDAVRALKTIHDRVILGTGK